MAHKGEKKNGSHYSFGKKAMPFGKGKDMKYPKGRKV